MLVPASIAKLKLTMREDIVTAFHRRADIVAPGSQRALDNLPMRVKRGIDIGAAATLLVFVFPLMVSIGVLIKLDSPGAVLSRQRRLGRNNQPFDQYNFRSMHAPACTDPAVPRARRNPPRVTRVGRFLRRTSLYELPQLINVLKGEMSLVGTRPHAGG
jgi:lipopolysaccharide/colanic/teichoic acid biosynthesis glycosyltransferase